MTECRFDPSPAPDGRTACQRAAAESALLRAQDQAIALVTGTPEPAYRLLAGQPVRGWQR